MGIPFRSPVDVGVGADLSAYTGNPYARAEGGIEQDPLVEWWHPLLQVQAAEGVVVHFHAEARTIRARVMSPWREGRT
jgi:hypothetical protein